MSLSRVVSSLSRRSVSLGAVSLGFALAISPAFAADKAPADKAAAPADKAPAAKAAAEPKANVLTAAEKKAGFKLLFDGKTTKGWRGYGKKEVPASWKAVDGTLTFEKVDGQAGDIVTLDQYDSFELLIDWKISEAGNSGVMYHVEEKEGEPPYKSGPEMQVLDNGKHPDGKKPATSSGAAYALYPPAKDDTRPVGEWNQARLVVDNNKVEHFLNGEKQVSYELGSDDWNAKVAASKFKDWNRFGKIAKGHIDLQDHGNKVWFRNIKVRVIKPAKAAAKPAAAK